MIDWLVGLFNKFGNALVSVFPTSPFRKYIDIIDVSPFVGNINWFIPVHTCLIMLNAWLVSIALYYGYMIIARWIKLIN